MIRKTICVLGVDIGKNLCSLVGLDDSGKVVLRRRARALDADHAGGKASSLHRCDGGLLRRASSSTNLAARGHEVRLMSPEYVRPYIKAQKNDERDAEEIAEAATRPTMRFAETIKRGRKLYH